LTYQYRIGIPKKLQKKEKKVTILLMVGEKKYEGSLQAPSGNKE
jgi:hypothetical protein